MKRGIWVNLLVLTPLLIATSSGQDGRGRFSFPEVKPEQVGMDEAKLAEARDYTLRGGGSGCILRGGRLVMTWGDQHCRYDVYSSTKSIGVTALGLAIMDGKVNLHDRAKRYLPGVGVPPEGNAQSGWLDELTLWHLATQTGGFEKTRGWCRQLKRPGTAWIYSDGGPNWLADCLTIAYGRDLLDVMTDRVFQPLGITVGDTPKGGDHDLHWGFNYLDRPQQLNGINRRPFGAGIHANVEAMAKIGYLYLRRGRWQGKQIIPEDFVDLAGRSHPEVIDLPVGSDEEGSEAGAPRHYGLLWWNNADGAIAGVPRDAFWSWGLQESFIIVVPSLDIVAARAGDFWAPRNDPKRTDSYNNILKPFLLPICQSVARGAPYPPSRVTTGVQTAPAQLAGASPAAEGFGAAAAGGRGGRIIVVTNRNDSGAGSLREALSARGPRIVRFAVEGTIELESPLVVTEGQVTIDGDTAPGQGITLRHHGIHFRGDCKDIIVRHLRIRVTTGGSSGDGLLFWGTDGGTVERVLVERCSLMGATDENVDTWGQARDITFQWTIIAEGRPPHSMGWLSGLGSDRITIHHCLFAHNADRSPRIAGGRYDVVNNVIYNWSHHNAAKIGGGAHANFVNNAFIPGPQSTATQGCILPEDPDKGTQVYLAGNMGPFTPTGAEDQWLNVTYYQRMDDRWIEHRPAPAGFRATKPFPVDPVTTQSAKEAYDLVLARVGARVRDADDLRVIEEVKARTGRVGGGRQ